MSIPKIIHYCWFGEGEIPDRDKRCIESWKKYCPDYEIIEWNEDNYDVNQIPYIKEAYEAKKWAFVSDYIRIDVVYRYGGIYMDTDVEVIRSLDDLLEYPAYVGLEAESNCIQLGCGFGAEKGNNILNNLREHYHALHFLKDDGTLDLTPNPVIVTEYLKKNGYEIISGEIGKVGDFTVFPEEYFSPQAFSSGQIKITNKTYSIHHYHASWQTEDEKKALGKYRSYTKIFGEHIGELLYQTSEGLKKEGFVMTVKKIVGHLKKK